MKSRLFRSRETQKTQHIQDSGLFIFCMNNFRSLFFCDVLSEKCINVFSLLFVAFEHVKLDIAKEQQVEIVFCCLLLVPPPPSFCSHHPLVTVFSFLKPSQKVQIKPSKPIPFSQSKLHCAHCTISDAKMMCHTHITTLYGNKNSSH